GRAPPRAGAALARMFCGRCRPRSVVVQRRGGPGARRRERGPARVIRSLGGSFFLTLWLCSCTLPLSRCSSFDEWATAKGLRRDFGLFSVPAPLFPLVVGQRGFRLPQLPCRGVSSTSRTFWARAAGVNGLDRKVTSDSETPRWSTASPVYPEMYRTLVPGREARTFSATRGPSIPGMRTSVTSRWIGPLWPSLIARA